MTRTNQRRISLVAGTAFSIALILGFFDDVWLFRNLPGKYLGFASLALMVLGVFGINVWIGGPLDMRNDPDDTPVDGPDKLS